MEHENLNTQLPPQPPPPPSHRKDIAGILGIFLITAIFVAAIVLIKNPELKVITPPPAKPAMTKNKTAIEISADDKFIINSETKENIVTIEEAINYLKNSGHEANLDNQATYGGKCVQNCFVGTALSNKKDSIVFSAVWFPKDQGSRPWIGVYKLPVKCPALTDTSCQPSSGSFQFLLASNGINFVWSQDDKTITYDGGMNVISNPEKRTIDANSGELLETKPAKGDSPSSKIYRNEKYGFELTFPDNWTSYQVMESDDNNIHYLSFMLRLKDNIDVYNFEQVFAIGIFAEKDWKEKNTVNTPLSFTYLAKNNDYYFGYRKRQEIFSSSGFVGVKSETELASDVTQILSTFKFIDQDKTN